MLLLKSQTLSDTSQEQQEDSEMLRKLYAAALRLKLRQMGKRRKKPNKPNKG